MNILIISGHPDLKESLANQTILDELEKNLPDAQIRKLDKLYPDFQIDVPSEQEALLWADTIVWQFPFHWYGLPALMKQWLDCVFLHGFAHGSNAKLGDKKLLLSITAGAPDGAYQTEGVFEYPLAEFLRSQKITAKLCNLDWQTPVYTCGFSYIDRNDETAVANQQKLAKQHAERVIKALKG